MKIKITKDKVYKYSKILVLLFLATALIGIFFIQSSQFVVSNPQLDLLVPLPRGLNWLALILLLIGWIVWEFAISKSGKKLLGFVSAGLIFSSVFFTFNALTFAFGLGAVVLIILISFVFLPKRSAKSIVDTLTEAKEDNKATNFFKRIFKRS